MRIGIPTGRVASIWYMASSCLLLLPPLLFFFFFFFFFFFISLYNSNQRPLALFLNHHYHYSPHCHTVRPLQEKITDLDKIEQDLARAREAIHAAVKFKNITTYTNNHGDQETTFVPRGLIYRNPIAFHQSHIEMMKTLKVWTYQEGDPPLVHVGPFQDIYGIEGHFINELETNTNFMARRPEEAHVFFLPFTVAGIVEYVYKEPVVVADYSRRRLQNIALDYINSVALKYPFWNRSLGADHFMAACHDWGPDVSLADPKRLGNMMRVLCNANTSEGFRPNRDVSLPDIFLAYGELSPTYPDYGPNKRPIFAFFSGGAHGEIRERLFRHWKDEKNDKEIQVYEYLKKGQNYRQMMRESRFCLCPSGFEVACPRPMESIYAGCVPVIISNNYSLPFSDVLDWSKFSVQVPVEKIPQLKAILKKVSYEQYLQLQRSVTKVRRHFLLHRPPKPFDVIHMALHSVWLRRLNVKLS